MLIETDVLLAALNAGDTGSTSARKTIARETVSLSPFTLLEINLLARAGRLDIRAHGQFASDLQALLDANSIPVLADAPEYHAEAYRLETRYKLGFFDSLHAAVARLRKEVIVSYDRAYDRLGREDIVRLDPERI